MIYSLTDYFCFMARGSRLMAKGGRPGPGARGRARPGPGNTRSQKARDWTKMHLSLPGEGRLRGNVASWHNDNDFAWGGWGRQPIHKTVMQISIPPGGRGPHPLRYKRNENPADYNHSARCKSNRHDPMGTTQTQYSDFGAIIISQLKAIYR